MSNDIYGGNTYPGGKAAAGVYQLIINQTPPSKVIISCFLGNCAFLRNITPAETTIGIDLDPRILEMWRGVHKRHDLILFHCNSLDFINNYNWSGKEFVYLDPTYLLDSRSSKRRMYKHELTTEQHISLLESINEIGKRGVKFCVSHYRHQIYDKYLKSWRKIDHVSRNRARTAIDTLWMNYSEPTELHDYRFVGSDYRERDRIRKKINREITKLGDLPDIERNAILNAIKNKFMNLPESIAISDDIAGHIAKNDDDGQKLRDPHAINGDAGSERVIIELNNQSMTTP